MAQQITITVPSELDDEASLDFVEAELLKLGFSTSYQGEYPVKVMQVQLTGTPKDATEPLHITFNYPGGRQG